MRKANEAGIFYMAIKMAVDMDFIMSRSKPVAVRGSLHSLLEAKGLKPLILKLLVTIVAETSR